MSLRQRLLGSIGERCAVAPLVQRNNATSQLDPTLVALLAAAMRACDHHNDSDSARKEMRRDCLQTPVDLRADLLSHFETTYPKDKP